MTNLRGQFARLFSSVSIVSIHYLK